MALVKVMVDSMSCSENHFEANANVIRYLP